MLGEFSLCGLTSNFAAGKLEIGIRMDIDCNGILRVDAEEARSGAKASFTVEPNQPSSTNNRTFYFIISILLGLTKNDIERHITYVQSDPNFAAKSGPCKNNKLYLTIVIFL